MDTSTFGERLDDLIGHFGETVTSFAERLDVSRQTIYDWKKLDEPTPVAIGAIVSAYPTVNVEWLKSGEGTMVSEKVGAQPASTTDVVQERTMGWPERFSDTFELIIRQKVQASGGPGMLVYEVDTIESDRLVESKQLFADLLGFWPPDNMEGIYIKGDSMRKPDPHRPGLPDGQLFLFQRVDELWDGGRFVLLLEDEETGDFRLVAKRVFLHPGGGIRIISDNKGAGLPDVDLVPNGSQNHFINKETGLSVRVEVVGRVLWPREDEEAEQMKLITRTIERMAQMGYRLPEK